MSKGILTKREKEVFSLLIENKTTREIANILSISEKTVRNHISNTCLLYTSPSPRDGATSRMPSSA